jgi:zinc protease
MPRHNPPAPPARLGARPIAGVAVLAVAVSLGLAAPSARAERFAAESFTLANGLRVVVVPNHRAPAVTQMLWYRVGSADDPPGKSGSAHFLEHLMFKGTASEPPGAFSRLIAAEGGRDNASTAQDYTVFYETVARDQLALAMRLEADRMTGLKLDDAVVLPERNVVLEERHMRVDNRPSALLSEELRAAQFLEEPYRNPTIGWPDEVRRLGTADALAFYRRWYMPNNAILIVAGDTDGATVKGLAERYFGPIAPGSLPLRRRAEEPAHHAAIRLTMTSSQTARPSWYRTYLAPSYVAGDTRLAYPLQVLAEVLGGDVDSRLYKALVLKRGLALAAGATYRPGAVDMTTFGLYAAPKPGVAIADFEAAVDRELRHIVEHGIPSDEVRRAERRMQAAAIYDRDSLAGPARIIGAALAIGRTIADAEDWPKRIGQVTPADVAAAARAVLVDHNSATAVLLPSHTS